ncbi:MAG: C13 family peptidase [Pseudomonadota bacterium]
MKVLLLVVTAALGFSAAVLIQQRGLLAEPVQVATLVDGGRYTGDITDGVLQGSGTLEWPRGASYVGEFKDGLMHGQGEYVDAFGNRYQGQFVDGQFTGNGEIYSTDGNTYKGETQDWVMHGEGEFEQDDSRYRGRFKKGQFSGEGAYFQDDELVYEGMFEDWVFHGEGKLIEDNGYLVGEFEEGMPVSGTRVNEEGDRYNGEFFYLNYHGEGQLKLANGDTYTGQFRYGQYHGDGAMRLAEPVDGVQEYSGTWRKGRLVESSETQFVEEEKTDIETALYRERTMLDTALANVPQGDPTKTEVFFLGIAGDGTERVFSREVTAFRDYFDQIAPLASRQINLINDRSTIAEKPMATMTSIGEALGTLSERMDRDRDLLVLYITSHGSKDHYISLKNRRLELEDLSSDKLAQLLDDSGIRWQVILVSACFSGGFIEPLKGESRLIMTAAAADKTSFGCSDEAVLTYFGRALLESLDEASSFEEAYSLLQTKITSREAEEDLPASEPQLFVGDKVSQKLRQTSGLFKGQPAI